MVDPITGGGLATALQFGITDWVTSNPIIAGILVALLALFFFFYLMLRRAVLGFKEGVKQGSDRK